MMRCMTRATIPAVWAGTWTTRRACAAPAAATGADAAAAATADPQARVKAALAASPVAFASASSSEMRPRVAAAEAFDLAMAALPEGATPNLCIVHVSMDHASMFDAPEVVWHCLGKANSRAARASAAEAAASGAESRPVAPPVMLGGAVRQQRLGGGYIEVMLGSVPGLRSTHFTFDEVPAALSPEHPAPFLGVSMLDWKLTMRHMSDINQRLDAVSALLAPHGAPLVGGVYPPAETAEADDVDPAANNAASAGDSMFFFNDNVLRGSAGAIVLHSDAVKADMFTTQPSVAVFAGQATTSAIDGAVWVLKEIDGRPAADVVRQTYKEKLEGVPRAKLCLALGGEDGAAVPLGFFVDRDTMQLMVPLPPALAAGLGQLVGAGAVPITLVADAEVVDREAIARGLMQYRASRAPLIHGVTSDITVQREGRRQVTASNHCALHYSHPQLYEVFRRDDVLTLSLTPGGGTTDQHAPSIAHRIMGGAMPAHGVYCAGQVMPLASSTEGLPAELAGAAGSSMAAARSSVHVMLRPAVDPEPLEVAEAAPEEDVMPEIIGSPSGLGRKD